VLEELETRRECSVKRRDEILSEKNEQKVSAIEGKGMELFMLDLNDIRFRSSSDSCLESFWHNLTWISILDTCSWTTHLIFAALVNIYIYRVRPKKIPHYENCDFSKTAEYFFTNILILIRNIFLHII